jgi:N-acetylglutamate synthase-like GNAT family acetyltransferase
MMRRIPFLRQEERQGEVRVELARPGDLPAIRRLLHSSRFSYSGLGGAIREAVRDDLTLVAWQGDALAGFAIVHTQGPQAAWLHAFGLAEDVSPTAIGLRLLEALVEEAAGHGIVCLAYMDEHALSWLRRLLEAGGFVRETSVVAYETSLLRPPAFGNHEALVRAATQADIPAVAACDQRAFGALWGYGERVFWSIFSGVACFLIAEVEGTLAGYLLATRHGEAHAHIVRLAVEPAWQGRQVAVRLLAESFARFREMGVRTVSLNTQQENLRSQRLYRWFGFRPTGDCIGVWVRRLRPGCMPQEVASPAASAPSK